uniref:HTH myb-type domain-containing protein n=1 Tax=Kalanchoe fedtschenkoi TaxID=63787 RepID=A0A7N0V142_KALFE
MKLPGRTDNDIKNFWNTRIKKLQRAGLPIYPPDVCLKKANDSQKSPDSGTLSDHLTSGHFFMEASNFVIPEFKIERPLDLRLYSYPSPFLDSPTSNMLPQGLDHPQERPPESNNTPRGLCNTDAWEKQHPLYQLPPPPESHSCADPSLCFPVVSHALINGNPSSFEPDFGSVKLELPSLQSLESDFILGDDSATPILPFEDSDPLAQFTQAGTNPLQYTPDTDGLLESVICPPKSAKSSKDEFGETYPEHKTTGDGDDLYFDFSGNELEAFAGHITPMDASIPSIFSDFTTSIDELQSTEVGTEPGTLYADFEQYLTCPNMNGNSDPYQLDPSRPDTWFNANLLSPNSEQGRNYHTLQQALSAIAGNDTQQLQP